MRIMFILDHPYTIESADNVPHWRSFTAAVTAAAMRGSTPGRPRGRPRRPRRRRIRSRHESRGSRRLAAEDRGRPVGRRLPAPADDGRPRGVRLPRVVGGDAGVDQGLPRSRADEGIVFDEVAGAKGNPFLDPHAPARGSDGAVGDDHTRHGLPLVVPRSAHQDPGSRARSARSGSRTSSVDQLRGDHRQDGGTARTTPPKSETEERFAAMSPVMTTAGVREPRVAC